MIPEGVEINNYSGSCYVQRLVEDGVVNYRVTRGYHDVRGRFKEFMVENFRNCYIKYYSGTLSFVYFMSVEDSRIMGTYQVDDIINARQLNSWYNDIDDVSLQFFPKGQRMNEFTFVRVENYNKSKNIIKDIIKDYPYQAFSPIINFVDEIELKIYNPKHLNMLLEALPEEYVIAMATGTNNWLWMKEGEKFAFN